MEVRSAGTRQTKRSGFPHIAINSRTKQNADFFGGGSFCLNPHPLSPCFRPVNNLLCETGAAYPSTFLVCKLPEGIIMLRHTQPHKIASVAEKDCIWRPGSGQPCEECASPPGLTSSNRVCQTQQMMMWVKGNFIAKNYMFSLPVAVTSFT